ncbi:MAG: S-methyl-5-thioribose-1-phosphate isomerase [Thermoanaerobaculia bacterium]
MTDVPAGHFSSDFAEFSPVRFADGALELLDQTLLPEEERWISCRTVEDIAQAIRRLAVRGAPAIGIAAAYGLVVALLDPNDPEPDSARRFENARAMLERTRPTAVNLRWALEQGEEAFELLRDRPLVEMAAKLLDWARALHADDVDRNRRMADHGARLFTAGDRVLTHCNAGALATGGIGTAVGVIAQAFRDGNVAAVWVDETRPLLQGARLTAWEMLRLGIPHRLVTDSMVGALMSRGHVQRVIVGADRIAANGDVANKIGTYTVAVLAHRHKVPFYVAAPLSTFDSRIATGAEIPIEERAGLEVTELAGERIAPVGTSGFNLAFDVTPAELITAIVTEEGVLLPPFKESIAALFN